MTTPKAAYWFALALFAVALHSEYQRGAFPALHHAASRAGVTLCRVATNVEHTVAMARMISTRPTVPAEELRARIDARELADALQLPEDQKEMIREQVRAQAEVIRAQVLQQRGQLEEMRSHALRQVRISNAASRSMVIDCPRRRSRIEIHTGANISVPSISVPNLPDAELDIPALAIDDSD